MSTPVNLRQERKNRARARARADADANAVKFGRSKAQRKLEATSAQKARSTLDAHRRETE